MTGLYDVMTRSNVSGFSSLITQRLAEFVVIQPIFGLQPAVLVDRPIWPQCFLQ